MARRSHPEPIFTGRYGADRERVTAEGRDFVVVNVADGDEMGVHVFPKEDNIKPDERFGSANWTDCIVMRAYNSEDAARNWWGAISQWHVWANYPKLDWETEPFTDAAGNFPPDGGDHGGLGYDAYPPDETAVDGITMPFLFSKTGGCVRDTAILHASRSAHVSR